MHHRFRPGPRAALLSLTVLLALASSRAADAQRVAMDPGPEVDRILAAYAGADVPGVAVAVVRGGEIVFQRAYGMAELSQGIPLTVATRSNIASTAKQFTAFGVSLLAEQGRLSLDDDVRLYLPELPDFGDTVTLRHLLAHTSGYREIVNTLAIGGWRIDVDHMGRDQAVTVVQRQPALQSAPGAERNYNNTGYMLLSLVIERVTGQPFPEWMRQNVFEPVGMTETVVRGEPRQVVPRAAYGYVSDEGDRYRHATDVGAAMGAAAVYSTVGDMARWMGNLATARHGGRAVLDRLLEPVVLASGRTIPHGLGLDLGTVGGLRAIHHDGGDIGHASYFTYFPDLDAGIIVLSNHAGFPAAAVRELNRVFFGAEMAAAATAPAAVAPEVGPYDPADFDPARFDAFAGRYSLDVQPGFVLAVRREGNRFLAQAVGQYPVEMAPTSDSTFFVAALNAPIAFHTDDTGQATGLTLHQGGAHHATRLPAETPDLDAYTGRFYSAEVENALQLELDGEQLVVRQRRLDPIRLTHAGGDTFTGTFPLFRVVFERDEAGAVSALLASNLRAVDVRFEREAP